MTYPDSPISETKLNGVKMLVEQNGEAWLDAAPWPALVKTVLRTWLFPTVTPEIDLESVPNLFSGDEIGDIDVILAEVEKDISLMSFMGERIRKESIDPREMSSFQNSKTRLFERWIAEKKALTDARAVAVFKAAVMKTIETHLTADQRAAFIAALRTSS